ncbi:hypothetical protein DI53_2746 [Sphingobacterium deserti]|uniref:Uncharacterized protein n=1 Tax=Sphingobacterium deserti TaxID=1229276 RepID=A0A0B8T028_9SPHI|nr:hypothetical protein DI53_2746 [Sphingobacterium deserti]
MQNNIKITNDKGHFSLRTFILQYFYLNFILRQQLLLCAKHDYINAPYLAS